MFPPNHISPGDQAREILADIQAQLEHLPEECIIRILPELQVFSSQVHDMDHDGESCRHDLAAVKKGRSENHQRLVNEALVVSNIALRKGQEQFRASLSNAPVAVFQTDQELRYVWFFSPFLGIPEELLIGKRDDEIFPRDGVAEFIDIKWQALQRKEVLRRELTLAIGDQSRTLVVSVEPAYGPKNDVVGVIGSCLDVTELRRLEAREVESSFQLEVNRRLLDYRERERQELARHIHDGPIQDLSSMGFSIQLARELSPDSEVAGVLDQLGSGVKSLVGDLREVTDQLRPAGLIRFGLTNAIRACVFNFEKRYADVQVKLSLPKAANHLPESTTLALYRIFQECLANIARHARASKVTITLQLEQDKVLMAVEDNGAGFDLPRSLVQFTRLGCYGLALMKERAQSVGGELKVITCQGQGTTIQVSAALPRIPALAVREEQVEV